MKTQRYQVALTTDLGNSVAVGELVANGNRCAFRYDASYIASKNSFPLDPINLDSGITTHETDKILFGVFEDSLPDGWGRSLIAKTMQLSHAQQSPHLLLQHPDQKAIGALTFETDNKRPHFPFFREGLDSLNDLAAAASAFEQGDLQDDLMLQRLFRSAGSAGGAHPKLTLADADGHLKLIKLPSIRDIFDVVGLEASCLELARMAGITVPLFTIMESGGLKMLCLDRFDRTDMGCRHMISMQSLLNATGYYHSSYVQMADVIRMVSCDPAGDLHALFRQMIFNALIGNTDDHLKNFSMYHCGGYTLTPAYDLLPDINQRGAHTLSFGTNDIGPCRNEATGTLAARFKITPVMASHIVDEVIESVSANWTGTCAAHEVPLAQANKFGSYIERQRIRLTA